MRQCPDRYTFRAGQNLPDKEFRYLRTVIVTAAVYRGFNSMLSHLLLTFRHLPSSLTTLLPLALESSSYLPVSVCGTGTSDIHTAFLASLYNYFPTCFRSLTTGSTILRLVALKVSLCLNLSVATEFQPYVHRLRVSASP